MRLSREGRIVLEELKLDYLINGETKTSGEIIDEIFESFRVEIYDIDWSLVLNNPEYDGVLADYTSVNPTTLNLNQDTINTMDEFKEFFNQKLGMKRTVYRSFIIRIILKAFRLQKDGINIHIR